MPKKSIVAASVLVAALTACASSPGPSPTVTVTAPQASVAPDISSGASSSQPAASLSCLRDLDATAEGRKLIREAGTEPNPPLPATEGECAKLDDLVLTTKDLAQRLEPYRSSIGGALIDPKKVAAELDDPVNAAELWQAARFQLMKANGGQSLARELVALADFYRADVAKRRMTSSEAEFSLRRLYALSQAVVPELSDEQRQEWRIVTGFNPIRKVAFIPTAGFAWLKMIMTEKEFDRLRKSAGLD